MNKNKNLIIIAEIGINHEGCFQKAQDLLKRAAKTGVDVIKFQSYTTNRYASRMSQERFDRLKKFSLNYGQFSTLATQASTYGVSFLSTPLSEDWVDLLNPLCPAFKIASGDITFKPVIQKAALTGKPLFVSTGAATVEEIDQMVQWVQDIVGKDNLYERLILMHCVSAYPTPIDQANILSIPFLKEQYGLRVGYSNHVIGMNAALAAVALGADVIEVHFTDCKEGREFRDHALSFDENDLKNFVIAAHEIRKSLGHYGKDVQPCEQEGRPLMRKGIIATRDILKGQVLCEEDLCFARPSTEFTSNDINDVIGKTLKKDIKNGYLIPRSAV